MLMLRSSRPADGSSRGTGRDGRAGRLAAALLGTGVTVLAGTTVVRIQRMRRTAQDHAHDLERSATVGEGLGAPVRLLVLGDSAARGYGLTDPTTAFPQLVARGLATATGRRIAVTSLATDGHRTADVRAEQVPLVRAADPDVVVVSVGVNDAIGRLGPDEVRAQTRDLLDAVEVAGDGALVGFVPCPDLREAPGFGPALRHLVGWSCRRVARAQQQAAAGRDLVVVPLPRPDATMFGADGFHPGAGAHAAMARHVVDALLDHAAEVLARPVAGG